MSFANSYKHFYFLLFFPSLLHLMYWFFSLLRIYLLANLLFFIRYPFISFVLTSILQLVSSFTFHMPSISCFLFLSFLAPFILCFSYSSILPFFFSFALSLYSFVFFLCLSIYLISERSLFHVLVRFFSAPDYVS